MFLNILIIFFASTTLVLIAIKYGFLEILAITLSIVALIPVLIAVISYFLYKPTLTYDVGSKVLETEEGWNFYRFGLGIRCNKGTAIISNIFFSSDFGFIPENAPGSSAIITYDNNLEEVGFASIAKIGDKEFPIYPHMVYGYLLQLRSKENKQRVKLKLVIDASVDPMKQGLFSIFNNIYRYRFIKEIELDYKNLNRQEGSFSTLYF